MSHARTLAPLGMDPEAPGPYPSTGSQNSPVLLAMAMFVGVASVAAVVTQHMTQTGDAAAFAVLIAIGEMARIRLPGGREAAPLGAAVALSYAVVTEIGKSAATHRTSQAIAVAGFGFLAGSVPHLAVRRPSTLDYPARRFLAVAFTAWLFRMLYLGDWKTLGHLPFSQIDHKMNTLACVAVMAGALSAGLALDALLGSLVQAGRNRRPFLAALRDEMRFTIGIGLAVGATALLVGLACRAMSLWVLPILCLPLLFTQLALRRYSRIKAVHLETIRALSRITEVAGLTERGHARRVARMAQRIGRELGLSERQLLDLEYAALMHDIGQLSLTDPIFGGKTVNLRPPEQRELAQAAAEVIRSTGVLDTVAELVERQAEPYSNGGPLGSRILRVANAYDDLAGTCPDIPSKAEALDVIRSGLAVHYDPAVVESLTRIVLEDH